jgi:hypothetical protein
LLAKLWKIKNKSAYFQPKCLNPISSQQLSCSNQEGRRICAFHLASSPHKRIFYFNEGVALKSGAKSASAKNEKQNNNSPRCFLASANIKNVKRLSSSTLGGGILRCSALLLKTAAPVQNCCDKLLQRQRSSGNNNTGGMAQGANSHDTTKMQSAAMCIVFKGAGWRAAASAVWKCARNKFAHILAP